MFFHYHYRHHHYIQWWESAGDKSPPLSLLSKPHHGGLLTGGDMPVSHVDYDDEDDCDLGSDVVNNDDDEVDE